MSGIVMIRSGSESDLQAAVAFAGPVAVAVDASSTAFRVSSVHHNIHAYRSVIATSSHACCSTCCHWLCTSAACSACLICCQTLTWRWY